MQTELTVEIKDIDPNPRTKANGKGHGHGHGHSQSRNDGNCKFCRSKNPPRKFPAYGQQCNKFNGKNHLAECTDLGPDHRVVTTTKVRISVSLHLNRSKE